jgi:hypothetical protein
VDRHEKKLVVEKRMIFPPGTISVGLTHIDGKLLFKHGKKWSKCFYGICHYSKRICIITPSDYFYPALITSVDVEPIAQFCSIEHVCLNFRCPMNKFNKGAFIKQFKGIGAFSLGLPLNLGSEPLWFNNENGGYARRWEDMIIPIAGGIKWFNEGEKNVGD